MKQYELFELKFDLPEPQGSWVKTDLQAEFECGGEKTTVKGFYDGNGRYIIRFLPLIPGEYTYKVSGITQDEGKIVCEPKDNRHHGPVRAKGLHFAYDDGSNYYPFGTTIYALAHQSDDLVERTLKSISRAPFNKVRLCLFPKDYLYNKNDPEYYAFEKIDGRWDVNKPCFAFWQRFESILSRLLELDIQCDLIVFHPYDRWGFAGLSKEESLTYLDYLVRRFSAFENIWWSLANEYDLMGGYDLNDWRDFGNFIANNDHSHHLISNHNCFSYYDFTLPEITHCSIQDVNANEVYELAKEYKKPVVFDEICYEGNIDMGWGNISAKELVHRFWTAVSCGGYCTHGETYCSEDDVLWWAKGGELKGESPQRIAFLRKLIESLPSPLKYNTEGALWIDKDNIFEFKKNGVPEELKNDFMTKYLCTLPDERVKGFILKSRGANGVCDGGEAAVWYLGKSCPKFNYFTMPSAGKYSVEILDTWEMTTEQAGVFSGRARIDLPGKEGIAVVARRIGD